jgi:hypothetical protein
VGTIRNESRRSPSGHDYFPIVLQPEQELCTSAFVLYLHTNVALKAVAEFEIFVDLDSEFFSLDTRSLLSSFVIVKGLITPLFRDPHYLASRQDNCLVHSRAVLYDEGLRVPLRT